MWGFLTHTIDWSSVLIFVNGSTRVKIQTYLDSIGLLWNSILFVMSFSFASELSKYSRSGGNASPVVLYYHQATALMLINIATTIRFILTIRSFKKDRTIFTSVDKSNKCEQVFYDYAISSMKCLLFKKCKCTEPEHRVKSHKKTDLIESFKFNPSGGGNIVVGFLSTNIEGVLQIIQSDFRPNSLGALGPGIYFSSNFDMAERKSGQKGAYIVAQIDLDKRDEHSAASGNESKYLHFTGSPANDEFIVTSSSQIIKYVVVVDKSLVKTFGSPKVQYVV